MRPGNHWNSFLWLLIGLSLVRGVLYSAIIPPWQAPDEPTHYEYVRLLYEKRRLVRQEDTSLTLQREIIASMEEYNFWRFVHSKTLKVAADSFHSMWGPGTQLDRPPLYYIFCIPFYWLVVHQPMVVQLYTLRLVSVCLSALTVLVAFLTARELFPDDELLIAAVPAFVVFLPMFTHITSSINSDSLASLVASTIMYSLIVGLKRGFSGWRILGLAVLLFLGLVTKRTTVFTIPLALLVVGLATVEIAMSKKKRRLDWKSVGFMAGVFLIVGGLIGWLWMSRPGQMKWILDNYYADSSFEGYIRKLLRMNYSPLEFGAGLWVSAKAIFKSFWGRFGWLAVGPSRVWYEGIALVNLMAVVGFIVYLMRVMGGSRSLASWQKKGLLILLAGLGGNLALLIGKAVVDAWARVQGRYLFPAIIPIAIVFALGLREVVPTRYHRAWLVSYIVGLILYDSIVLTQYIIPFFYG